MQGRIGVQRTVGPVMSRGCKTTYAQLGWLPALHIEDCSSDVATRYQRTISFEICAALNGTGKNSCTVHICLSDVNLVCYMRASPSGNADMSISRQNPKPRLWSP